MENCTIIIGGDICPTESNKKLFEEGNTEILFDKLENNLKQANLNIINLECPLISEENPVDKIGPNLSASEKSITALKKANINVVNLGNNHVMDHGIKGAINTIDVLQKNNIEFLGIGENRTSAIKILIKKIKGINIGILSMAENGFYTAQRNKMGTAPIDIIDIYKEIIKEKDNCDYIIVLIHGGVEHFPYPSPKNQKLSRFLIDIGVDCVVWQHSHCSGYIERYNEKNIIYGQGNFIFDLGKMHPDWYKGFAIEIILQIVEKQINSTTVNIIPFVQSFNKAGIYVLENEMKDKFINELFSKQTELENDDVVYKIWEDFCDKQKEWYLAELVGYERLIKKTKLFKNKNSLNLKLFKKFGIDKENLIKLRNLMFSESHNEMIQSSLDIYIKDNKNIKKV